MQVDDLIEKLFHGEDTGKVKDIFWKEWDDFSDKCGFVYDRDVIWNGTDIENGETYKWHSDVKHIKTDKRSHISSSKI